MNNKISLGDVLFAFVAFLVIGLFVSVCISMLMWSEYQKHPDYVNSDIFTQGRMQKETDCYGITIVKIGNRVVNANVIGSSITIPDGGSWETVKLSDLCPDQEFTVYRKNFWLLGNAYTIK
jgi:hypothetical protein